MLVAGAATLLLELEVSALRVGWCMQRRCFATSHRRVVMKSVELNSNEEELVSVLVKAGSRRGTTVRIVGGWVRDKALGIETKDVDVALDKCTGAAFAKAVAKVLRERGESWSSYGVIGANPQQSKHLETATMTVCGVEMDMVNLRSETYGENSRLPTTMAFGTPEEDASRRDFTVNALFYNTKTRDIEDFTGSGWDDLCAGILKTPLDPSVTLLDDPLRALRAVRFASKYDFSLDEKLRDACAAPEVHDAILLKVSRERVGIEVTKALASGAVRAATELRDLGLARLALYCDPPRAAEGFARGINASRIPIETIYSPPSLLQDEDEQKRCWDLAVRSLKSFAATDNDEDDHLCQIALLMSPLSDCLVSPPAPKAGAKEPLPTALCRDSLKLSNFNTKGVQGILNASKACRDVADRFEKGENIRCEAGNMLFELKDKWRAAFAVASARDVAEIDAAWSGDDLVDRDAIAGTADKYANVIKEISDDLDNVWTTLKPFFDGNELVKRLDAPKGPVLGELILIQRDFQLENPQADADACMAYLKDYVETNGFPTKKRKRHKYFR